MAHSISSRKRIRQNARRRAINRSRKSALKSKVRVVTEAFVHNQPLEAEKHIGDALRALDRAADRGTLHRNAAARRKSRMMRRLNVQKKKAAAAH